MFRRLVVIFMGGQVALQDTSDLGSNDKGEVIEIYFNDFEYTSDRSTLTKFKDALRRSEIRWLTETPVAWLFDPGIFRKAIPDFELPPWLQRPVVVNLDVRQYEDSFAGRHRRRAHVFMEITKDEMALQCNKVFLSHKSTDKDLVRKIANALELSGFDPWLDENEMPAGTPLERGISQGFRDSLAAVFFITEAFSDTKFLASEIDYAVREKRERDDFTIIPLRLTVSETSTAPQIPDLLGTYVWKSVESDLDAFIEIMKALKRN